jgi:hypothetical protein
MPKQGKGNQFLTLIWPRTMASCHAPADGRRWGPGELNAAADRSRAAPP